MDIRKNLEAHASVSPSHWREAAEARRANKPWLRFSQQVALVMLDRMEQMGLTQKKLADLMGCSQQYISKVLKGRENLSTRTKRRTRIRRSIICAASSHTAITSRL